jgi:hypothetical protein
MTETHKIILEYISKVGKRVTSKDIAIDTGLSYNKVAIALTRLYKRGQVKRFYEGKMYAYWVEELVTQDPPPEQGYPDGDGITPTPLPNASDEPVRTDYGLDGAVKTLARQLAVKVVGQLMVEVEHEIRQLMDQIVISGSPESKEVVLKLPSQAITKRKPKILIVGLLDDQRHHIEREFGDCFDFKYMGAEGSPATLKESLKHCAVVITMTGFISHWIDDTIKVSPAKDHFIRLSGGMTALRQTLTDIFCKME